MKNFIYSFFNKKVGAYESPIFNSYEKENFKELVIRDCLVSGNAAKTRMEECSLYYLGIFDDVECKFEFLPHPEFIIDLNTLINGKQEEKLDG